MPYDFTGPNADAERKRMQADYSIKYDEQGRAYTQYPGQTARSYVSPGPSGRPADTTGVLHSRPQWNTKTGKWDTPFDWGNLMTIGVASGLGVGALSAAGAFGGAAATSSSAGSGLLPNAALPGASGAMTAGAPVATAGVHGATSAATGVGMNALTRYGIPAAGDFLTNMFASSKDARQNELQREFLRQENEKNREIQRQQLAQDEAQSMRSTALDESKLDPWRHMNEQLGGASKADRLANSTYTPVQLSHGAPGGGIQRTGGATYNKSPELVQAARTAAAMILSGRGTAPTMTDPANYGQTGVRDLRNGGRDVSGQPTSTTMPVGGQRNSFMDPNRARGGLIGPDGQPIVLPPDGSGMHGTDTAGNPWDISPDQMAEFERRRREMEQSGGIQY